ncbi:MAG: GxxExxY protein [Brevinematales bacterium]|nr:GxxExxY protein [Brevinematales bacterium]
MKDINELSHEIIGYAIELHKNLGPGLLESLYEKAMIYELKTNNVKFVSQPVIPVFYKNHKIGEHRLDLLIEDTIIVELKSVERHDPVFEAQLLSYLKIADKKLGLLINFNTRLLKDGIIRMIL